MKHHAGGLHEEKSLEVVVQIFVWLDLSEMYEQGIEDELHGLALYESNIVLVIFNNSRFITKNKNYF